MLGCALATSIGACAPEEIAGSSALQIRVTTAEGEPVASFFATVGFADDEAESVTCPPGTTATDERQQGGARLGCTGEGFRISGEERPRHLTVKSRTNAFVSADVDELARGTITVSPLAEAKLTEDYATRLDGADCLERLRGLAIRFDSELGSGASVKVYVRHLRAEPEVYFQNTEKHPLHFDFARRALGVTGTADQFAQNTYAGLDRDALGATLVFYPEPRGDAQGAGGGIEAPWTLNFPPYDAISPEQVRLAHRLVEERLTCLDWTGPTKRLVYVPATSESEREAADDDAGFARSGVPWMSRLELMKGLRLQALNEGVAYGRLRRLTAEELATEPLSHRDVLLLPRLPNELPLVGGTITEELQTPLAHVNVAARSRGTPNLAYPQASEDPRIAPLLGELVRFEVVDGDFTLEPATTEEARQFWESRAPARVQPTFDSETTGILSFADTGFADWERVGAKAANLAELTHVIPSHAPRAGLALPFHYYEAFMDSASTSAELCDAAESTCLASGRAPGVCERARELCTPGGEGVKLAELSARWLEDQDFVEDTALREAALASLRYCIEQTPLDAELGKALDDRVTELFGDAKVKLRSSTNTEDLPSFSGAGLYSSYGAYGHGSRAASKVLTKVFASTWSFRAFEERSFWNIDHSAVRMGCAINEAFSGELANGVLITDNIADPNTFGMYVNVQKGEAEVTNPENGQLPEIFSILGDAGYRVARSRYSSLSPDSSLLSSSEIQELYDTGDVVRAHFSKLYGRPVVLDIEFKVTQDRRIVFKQARPYTTR